MIMEKVIQRTVLESEINRKSASQQEWDIYTGNIRPYVEEKLLHRFPYNTVKQLPIISCVNILKKMVNQKATLYRDEPTRTFSEDISEDQAETLNEIYKQAQVNYVMMESNKLFEMQEQQTHLLVEKYMNEDEEEKLRVRPIKNHQLTVIEKEDNHECGEIYAFSHFDRDFNDEFYQSNRDNIESGFMELGKKKWTVWTKDFNFTFTGNREIITPDGERENQLGIIPIVEVSGMKDWLYWRQITNDIADFVTDYNMMATMNQQISEYQFSQAVVIAPENLMPDEIKVGPNRIIKLLTNPDQEGQVDFKFVTPSSDIAGIQAYQESILAQFLSSQGLDSDLVSGEAKGDVYNSGVERLLAMIEKFEASKEVRSLYKKAEQRLFDVMKAYLSDMGVNLPEDSKVMVKFAEPQSILSEIEKLDIAERKMDLGVWDEAKALSYLEDIDIDEARNQVDLIESMEMRTTDGIGRGEDDSRELDQTEDRS